MVDDYLEMCADFENLIADEDNISGNSVLEILKKYSSKISVFDMMSVSAEIIEENKYVQENYRKDSQKSYVESFILRIKEISGDKNNYPEDIKKEDFAKAIENLKSNHTDSKSKFPLLGFMASIYTTFILKEPIHRVGTPFPGSLKVEEKNGRFYCPVRDANIDTPNAVCNICLAEQLEF